MHVTEGKSRIAGHGGIFWEETSVDLQLGFFKWAKLAFMKRRIIR